MNPDHSITNLISAMKHGDSESIRGLWERYFARLVALASKNLGNAPRRVLDEEDVALSVFDDLVEGAAQGRFTEMTDRQDLWILLVVMVKQKAIDQIRYHSRKKRGGDQVRGESVFDEHNTEDLQRGLEKVVSEEPTPDMLVQMREECQRLLQQLPKEIMRTIALRRMAGYTNEEISDELGISLRSVERKLQLIRTEWSEALGISMSEQTSSPTPPYRALAYQIDDICDAFENALRAGNAPDITEFLNQVNEEHRSALLRELLLADIAFRQAEGSTATAQDYAPLLPEYRNVIHGIFMEQSITQKQGNNNGLGIPTTEISTANLPTHFGRYELLGKIARGGMGIVVRAYDPHFQRHLAVKVMLPEDQNRVELENRFWNEAQIAGQLQHPGIAPLYDLGRLDDGRPFFAMKLIEGQTLSEILKNRDLCNSAETDEEDTSSELSAPQCASLPRLIAIFEQICQTMAYAHSHDVIHRDLKPSNVMVGAVGEVQVMDWGLAKRIREPKVGREEEETEISIKGGASEDTPDAHTKTGTVIGTPAYMAPEQARGEIDQLDKRCDVFGLGAILCVMCTGKPPYEELTPTQVITRVAGGDVADAFVRLDGCGADAELVQLAKQCLAENKEDRPADAGVVAEAITTYQQQVQEKLRRAELQHKAAEVQAIEQRKRWTIGVALASVVLLLIVGVTGAAIWYVNDLAYRQQHLRRSVAKELNDSDRALTALNSQLKNPTQVHTLLSDIDGWKTILTTARQSWQRGKSLAEGNEDLLDVELLERIDAIKSQLDANDNDWKFAKQLDGIRLNTSTLVDGRFDPAHGGPKYAKAFADAGWQIEQGDVQKLAKKIRQSPLRYVIVASLDHWAVLAAIKDPPNRTLERRLSELARAADADPWRDQIRRVANWHDRTKIEGLMKNINPAKQSPQILFALSLRLHFLRHDSTDLMRKALLHYPRDFCLLFHLGNVLQDPVDKAAYYRAALAIRPKSSETHTMLGNALHRQGDPHSAIVHFRKALEYNAKNTASSQRLGHSLCRQGRYGTRHEVFRPGSADRPR